MRILLLGLNHRSAPLEVRERLVVDDPAPFLQKLVDGEAIEEAALISTCNRVEVVALGRRLDAARHRLRGFFRHELGGSVAWPELERSLYDYADSDAMRHVLRVASALDSMVVGEPQILGQTKDAYRAAVDSGAAGPILGRLFQHAFTTAKRVRTETRIAERPVSVARVAVDLARQIFEDLAEKRALLVGAGEMIELALDALRGAGLSSLYVANRTRERAAQLAARYGATPHGLDELPDLLRHADIVLTSIGGTPIVTPEIVGDALRARRNRPIFLIDLGVPRNADPAVDEFDEVYLYDIDDLGSVAAENAELRQRETVRAEAIVAEEQERFDGWLAALRAVPTIKHLNARAEAIRAREVEKHLPRIGLPDAQREAVEALTRSIVRKLLHAPLVRLRREAENEGGMAYLEATRALFDLDREESDETDEGPEPSDPR